MNAYDLHIWFMDDREIIVPKIHEHWIRENVLHCVDDGKFIGSYPIHNIRKYVKE